MESIKERLRYIKEEIRAAALSCGRNPDGITLIAVSKKKSVELIQKGIGEGVTVLGENYIQEAVEKIDSIDSISSVDSAGSVESVGSIASVDNAGRVESFDSGHVSWHFIGHLQSNKAKFAVKYFDFIHTVHSFKLAKEISRQAEKIGRVQKILMQINISEEESKSGASAPEAIELARDISQLEHVAVKGLMGMPPFFDDPEQARPYFKALVQIKTAIEKENISGISMEHLSMGMSNDFRVAIEEGSTMVRIGTAIFGSRL